MITELNIKKDTVDFNGFCHIENLKFFKDNGKISFKKGINLILSHNGKGKTTLLNIIATGLAAKQGGYSRVTDQWCREVVNKINPDKNFSNNFEIIHDGQGIIYQNPRDSIGITHGSFDDDFFNEGIYNTLSKSSTGLTTLERMNLMFELFLKNETPKFDLNKYSEKNIEIEELFKAKIEKGQQTLLLDEPESGLSLIYQYKLFKAINSKAKELDLQIIIATHSPCLFLFSEPNIIELSDQYLSSLKNTFIALSGNISSANYQ